MVTGYINNYVHNGYWIGQQSYTHWVIGDVNNHVQDTLMIVQFLVHYM